MVKCLVVLCLLVASALAATHRQPRIDPNGKWRVVGGKDAEEAAHPHQISLRTFNTHSCGGSIVHPNWIITAAHCAAPWPAFSLTVVTGTNSLSSGGDTYKVLEIHYHEDYDGWNIQNDVAILKVETITLNDKVGTIAAETEELGAGVPCILTGWGRTSFPSGNVPDQLQELSLLTTTYEECRDSHAMPVIESEICTLTVVGEGACHGDSGGPLIREVDGKRTLIGTVSWGQPCAKGFPDVYSRVSSFVEWFNGKCDNCLNN